MFIHEHLNQLSLIQRQEIPIYLEQAVQVDALLLFVSRWVQLGRAATINEEGGLNLVKDFLEMIQVRSFLIRRVCRMLSFARVSADLFLGLTSGNFLVNVLIVGLCSCRASSFQHSLRDAPARVSVNFN